MTGNTRDYLADLANRKGVKLPGEQDRDQPWASRTIEELKALSDANFEEITPEQIAKIDEGIESVVKEIRRWTLV